MFQLLVFFLLVAFTLSATSRSGRQRYVPEILGSDEVEFVDTRGGQNSGEDNEDGSPRGNGGSRPGGRSTKAIFGEQKSIN